MSSGPVFATFSSQLAPSAIFKCEAEHPVRLLRDKQHHSLPHLSPTAAKLHFPNLLLQEQHGTTQHQ